MKWHVLVLAVLCVGMALVFPLRGGIIGSAHDFSTANWNFSGEICITCHTPHNAVSDVEAGRLWNHQLTDATFVLYSSDSFDGSQTIGQPTATSKLCLSCHDGTVALDNFGGFTGGTEFNFLQIGPDLSTSHPISFTYDSALAVIDRELYDPKVHQSGLGGTIDSDLLYKGRLECTSCHDVHNTAGAAYLLVKSNAGSALCLTCHNK